MDFNPYDPFQAGEALRDEVIGLRTTPERGFFSSEWSIKNTESGKFPERDRTISDIFSFRHRNHKSSQQSPEEYITKLLSGSHLRSKAFKHGETVKIIRGQICLEFAIESYTENVSPVMLDNGADTNSREAFYSLSYIGQRETIPLRSKLEAIATPTLVHFTDTGNVWEEYANAFSNHYVK